MIRMATLAACMILALTLVARISAEAQEVAAKGGAQDPPAKSDPASGAADKPVEDKKPKAKEGDPPAKEEQPKQPEQPPAGEPKTADEVMDMLRRQKPTNEPILPSSLKDSESSGASAGRNLLPEGTRISRKAGRIVKEGDWWSFVQESDHPDHPEPRFRLLPCLHLEQMVRETQSAAADIVYMVSGEVTVFEGENYLLVRLAARRMELGNLTP